MGGGLPSSSSSTEKEGRALLDAAAGAMAGCIARFVTGPLDVIKIRFQVQLEPIKGGMPSKYTGFAQALTTIVKEEGLPGLWRGTVPGLLLTVPYTAVQFVALQQVRELAAKYGLTGSPGHGALVSLVSGACAGAAGTIASYPFDLLRTTLAAQGEPKVYNNMFDAAKGILREKGPVGLYSGLGVTLVEIIPYAALQFGLYDVFNQLFNQARVRYARHMHKDESQLQHDTRFQHFTAGLAAGLFAKLATHPLDVAKKRYQIAGLQRSLKYGARVEAGFALHTLTESLALIFRNEGIRGLWKGSIPSLVKAAPSSAVTFLAYDVMLSSLMSMTRKDAPQKTA